MYGNLINRYRVSDEDTMHSKSYGANEQAARTAYDKCEHAALLQETDALIDGRPETVVLMSK